MPSVTVVALPDRFPMNEEATIFLSPMVQLSFVSSHKKETFETFFQNAELNPNAHLIKGVICGYRIEEIDNSLTQQVRFLDKLVDELAKGRKMEKILRKD